MIYPDCLLFFINIDNLSWTGLPFKLERVIIVTYQSYFMIGIDNYQFMAFQLKNNWCHFILCKIQQIFSVVSFKSALCLPEAGRSRCLQGKRRREPPHFQSDMTCFHSPLQVTCRCTNIPLYFTHNIALYPMCLQNVYSLYIQAYLDTPLGKSAYKIKSINRELFT